MDYCRDMWEIMLDNWYTDRDYEYEDLVIDWDSIAWDKDSGWIACADDGRHQYILCDSYRDGNIQLIYIGTL